MRAAAAGLAAEKTGADELKSRIASLGWSGIRSSLDSYGFATTGILLTKPECRELTELYDASELFRSRIVMARHGFGSGEYQYFAYPLPPQVEMLRLMLYEWLAPIANAWNASLGLDARFPGTHAEYVARCREAGTVQAHAASPQISRGRL